MHLCHHPSSSGWLAHPSPHVAPSYEVRRSSWKWYQAYQDKFHLPFSIEWKTLKLWRDAWLLLQKVRMTFYIHELNLSKWAKDITELGVRRSQSNTKKGVCWWQSLDPQSAPHGFLTSSWPSSRISASWKGSSSPGIGLSFFCSSVFFKGKFLYIFSPSSSCSKSLF